MRLVTLGYGIVFIVLFNHRYFGIKNRAFDYTMWFYCLPLVIPMFFMNMDTLLYFGQAIWVKGNLLLGVYIAIHLLMIFYQQHKMDAIYLLYAGLPLLIIGFRDMLVLDGRWTPENGFLINHFTLPALIVAMWFIVRRLANTLQFSEQLNVSLEQRVADSKAEIEAGYRQQEQLKKQQLLSNERERIMRDMHDGLGGHLIGVKSLLDSPSPKLADINDYVDRALIDLRLVINLLDTGTQNVSSLLGSMRNRWQMLADNKKCKLVWQVAGDLQQKPLGPHKTLQLMRILEETFTNALKHGQSGDITVASGFNEAKGAVWVRISNPLSSNRVKERGRGIKNMQLRASDIAATIKILTERDMHAVYVELPTSWHD